MPKTKSKEPWTPELWIQLFREAFTALLALVIIGFTLYLAVRSFNLAGDPKKIADAKDLLTIMLGIAGVVVGYYFGRVPGDARAAQATSRADTAVRQREQIKAQARSLAGQADDIISGAFSNARGGQPPPDLAAIRALRDELSDLASSAD
jgi:hypothetical protein